LREIADLNKRQKRTPRYTNVWSTKPSTTTHFARELSSLVSDISTVTAPINTINIEISDGMPTAAKKYTVIEKEIAGDEMIKTTKMA